MIGRIRGDNDVDEVGHGDLRHQLSGTYPAATRRISMARLNEEWAMVVTEGRDAVPCAVLGAPLADIQTAVLRVDVTTFANGRHRLAPECRADYLSVRHLGLY